MMTIKKILTFMHEELCDAEKYAKCAEKYRADHGGLAETFYDLAKSEVNHYGLLCETVAVLIAGVENVEEKKEAEHLHKWEREKNTDHLARINGMLSQYKS